MQNNSPFKNFFSRLPVFMKSLLSELMRDSREWEDRIGKEKVKPNKDKRKGLPEDIGIGIGASAPRDNSPIFVKRKCNPIITPNTRTDWDNLQTFNPGTVFLDGKVHFLYRALGNDYYSRLGYANSSDGFTIDERLPYPVFELNGACKYSTTLRSSPSGGGFGGCEDPRIVMMDDDESIYVTYTDFTRGNIRMAITSIDVEDFLNKKWDWKKSVMISPPNQPNKNWVIFPEKINGKYAILHSISPRIQIEYMDSLEFNDSRFIKSSYEKSFREEGWDYWVRGAGPPPLKTEDGWLLFYHAMSKDDYSKYKVGAMLLDLKDPTKVLHRSKQPILIPDACYENEGYKPGVVYVSGAVIKDGEIILHYGGADSYVCAAHADFAKFMESLKKDNAIGLTKKKIRTKNYAHQTI